MKLKKQVAVLEHNAGAALTYSDCITVDNKGDKIEESLLRETGRNLTREDLARGKRVPTLTVMFRRKDIEDLPVDEFCLCLNGDTFLFAFLGLKGTGEFIDDITKSAYRIHSGGLWTSSNVITKSNGLIGTFRQIYKTTSPELKHAVKEELRLKHLAKCLVCMRQLKPIQFFKSLIVCVEDCGIHSLSLIHI